MRHIRAFLAVARCRSFTRAATELHVSQPALTVQIQQLESTLGLTLFDRNKRQVSLTQAGRELVAPLERVLVELEAVINSTQDLLQHRRGIVSVAALPSVSAGMLPRAIRLLSSRHPGIVVRVRDVVTNTLLAMVKGDEVDFGIGSPQGTDRQLTVLPLFSDKLCAFVPPQHPLGKKRSVTPKEVAAHPLILMNRDSSVRELVERALQDQGLSVSVAYETNYMQTALGMVNEGLGVAILPESAVVAGTRTRLKSLPIRAPELTREIGVVSRLGRTFSPAARQLIEALQETAS